MPRVARACKAFPCVAITKNSNGYCDKHQQEAKVRQYQHNRHRGKKSNPFYGTKRWQTTRNRYIARHPLCERCGSAAQEVDHIVPLSEGGSDVDFKNLQALCRSCHARKTWLEQQ